MSMAEVGKAWQNGFAERVMRTLKEEAMDLSDSHDYHDAKGPADWTVPDLRIRGSTMELSLQTFFDLGVSYGLEDDIFPESHFQNIPEPNLRNPLGRGIVYRCDVYSSTILRDWRARAACRVDDPDMELGHDQSYNPSESAFKLILKEIISNHPAKKLEITVYSVGIAFLRLDFASGLRPELLYGFAHCFEYAAYEAHISMSLQEIARKTIEDAIYRKSSTLERLTTRPSSEGIEKNGETESRLLTTQGITQLVLCVDPDDDVDAAKRKMLPPISTPSGRRIPKYEEIVFEHCGTLYYNWSVCVIVPSSLDDPTEPLHKQIADILDCIQIAHSLLGASEAFENLITNEIRHQASSYAREKPVGRDPQDLTRLRILALAVVSLTDYSPITDNAEAQSYFKWYEKDAKIANRHKIIQDRCAGLLAAVLEAERLRQEQFISIFVLFLTGFTLLSAFTDSYTFIKEGVTGDQLPRPLILGFLVAIIIMMVLLVGFSRLLKNSLLRLADRISSVKSKIAYQWNQRIGKSAWPWLASRK